MLFNSYHFLIFFPLVTFLFFIIPRRFQWFLLLLASCVFYMAFIPYYILILLATILIDYWAGIQIEKSAGNKRKIYLVISIISTCLVLVIFKYFNFFNTNIEYLAHFFHLNYPLYLIKIALPVGLSFHTFQSLSYVIEVYLHRQKAEKHFGIYSLYVMFYPQLVAGPIERPQNLLPQFHRPHYFNYSQVTAGLQRMLLGLFKKVVVADNLAIYVNQVFDHTHDYPGLILLTATFFFAIQIYCDFSGYADIAIGSAKVMGFKLMENFNQPYLSLSVSEFWQRWHISLSTWFRDYVYIPLGGNRVNFLRQMFNLMATFLLSGLWHGANWTYIIWGIIHGTYLVISKILDKYHLTLVLPDFAKRIWVFTLVLIAWVFFRAGTLSDAFYILTNSWLGLIGLINSLSASLFHINPNLLVSHLVESLMINEITLTRYSQLWGLVLLVFIADKINEHQNLISAFRRQRPFVRWLFYLIITLSIMNLGVTQEIPFIYFQF